MVVLGIQQEIRAHNCHTNGDDDENNKYKKHKTIDIVNLVVPEGSEDKIHLNKNAPKGKKTSH